MRRVGGHCMNCQHENVCTFRYGLRNLLDTFERSMVFNDIDPNDNPRREFIELLANWCYWFKEREVK